MGDGAVLHICEGNQQTGEYVKQRLIEYNLQKAVSLEGPLVEFVYLVLKDADGLIVGGINATVKNNWGLCHVDIFWIDEKYRNCGYGGRLLQQVEEIAKGKGCMTVQLETASFQAPEFYRKQGYELIGTMEILPEGSSQYFFKKAISKNI